MNPALFKTMTSLTFSYTTCFYFIQYAYMKVGNRFYFTHKHSNRITAVCSFMKVGSFNGVVGYSDINRESFIIQGVNVVGNHKAILYNILIPSKIIFRLYSIFYYLALKLLFYGREKKDKGTANGPQ